MADPYDVREKLVLITGASHGLGRALAEAFAAAGARLALCARGASALEEVARPIAARGGAVVWRAADVRDEHAIGELVRAAEERWGPVAALINNASVLGERLPLARYPLPLWREVMDINVTGALIATQAVLPGMRRAGSGSIINVTSGVGNVPRADWGAYAVSKWALEALTYNLALEERGSGIRVNAVDPGAMRTRMRQVAYPEEAPERQTPPEEVTGVFLWLASDAAREVTGQRLRAAEWRAP